MRRFGLHGILILFLLPLSAADWPQWRQNPGRTAETTQSLGNRADWKILWQRELAKPDPAFQDVRLQFDRGYEPIVLGERLFVGSTVDGSVAAYSTRTGKELWKFYTNGPVRFAPVGGKGRILFGSDDGWFYCLKASDGALVWKFQAVPSDRKLFGNRRLISVWPVRGGPVLQGERVYFAAGVWPFEGVFLYCLDAASGKVIWVNDHCGHIYDQQPHNTEALGGLAPQGYLLIDPETGDLVVPSSNAYPARLDRSTGALKEFKLPSAGRLPGGWYASTPGAEEQRKLKRRGLLSDADVNAKRHEDKPRREGKPGIRGAIHFADSSLEGKESFPALPPGTEVYGIVSGDDKVFVTSLTGSIFALSRDENPPTEFPVFSCEAKPKVSATAGAERLHQITGGQSGFAIALGDWDFEILLDLLGKSNFTQLLVISDNAEQIQAIREGLTEFQAVAAPSRADRDLSGALQTRLDDPLACSLPPYLASTIFVSDSLRPNPSQLAALYQSLRPFGGQLVLASSLESIVDEAAFPRASAKHEAGSLVISREGALEGSTNYTGDFAPSPDALVRAPLGVLWFDDRVGNFKRAPQPKFIDGTMISTDKDWLDASTRTGKVDYRLLKPRFTDVYTGRELSDFEVPELRQSFSEIDHETIQPSQYRPEDLAERPTPENPLDAKRINPLTGEEEPRTFPMAYGCDNGIDYGNLYTMRSATAAFYDKTNESGTINLSGPRSGCTNSVIPANGVLNVPYFYEGCTCSYPLPTGMSLYSLPESQEQWTAWGAMTEEQLAGKIQKIGINFGAPGDRVTRDGLLWLDHPHSGGPSPQVKVTTIPENPSYSYRHSVFMKGGDGHPWVAASGVNRVRSVTQEGLVPGNYRVTLTFCQNSADSGTTEFNVTVEGEKLVPSLVLKDPFHSQTRTLENVKSGGKLTISLEPVRGETQISGMELIRTGP